MTANKSIPPPSLDNQTRSQTPYTLTATLRSPCAQPNNAPPPPHSASSPTPLPQWKEKEEIQVQPDRYYLRTLTLHSETGGDADLLGPHAIAGCTDIHTAVLTPHHHTVRQGGQLAVHLRPVGSANQPHCGCGSAIAGSTVKRHSLGFMHHLVALVTVQCQRDLAGWVWNISRHMLANTHVLNTCGITACNTNVWLKHVMQMCVNK